jgi:hypothetical protein
MEKRGVSRRGFLLLSQITITHYLHSFHMLSTKKCSNKKNIVMFSTLNPCFPSSPIPLSNKKIAIICAKKCGILHYLPLITQRHGKKTMRLNAIFYLLSTQAPLFISHPLVRMLLFYSVVRFVSLIVRSVLSVVRFILAGLCIWCFGFNTLILTSV